MRATPELHRYYSRLRLKPESQLTSAERSFLEQWQVWRDKEPEVHLRLELRQDWARKRAKYARSLDLLWFVAFVTAGLLLTIIAMPG